MLIDARDKKRQDQIMRWHRWFAWWPVSTEEGPTVWMRFVYRIGIPGPLGHPREFTLLYRLAPPPEDHAHGEEARP